MCYSSNYYSARSKKLYTLQFTRVVKIMIIIKNNAYFLLFKYQSQVLYHELRICIFEFSSICERCKYIYNTHRSKLTFWHVFKCTRKYVVWAYLVLRYVYSSFIKKKGLIKLGSVFGSWEISHSHSVDSHSRKLIMP